MKIGILGGSFDPPHLGHILIARQVREKLGLDKIWLMPVYHHPLEKKLTPAHHRLAMAKLLETDDIIVSDFEITQNQSSYTVDTLKKLQTLYPDDTFYWILGSDQLEKFTQYKDWQELVANYNLVIFPRETVIEHLEEKTKQCLHLTTIPQNVTLLHDKDLILTNISSTLVRTRLQRHESLEYIVPEAVILYSKKYNLYR